MGLTVADQIPAFLSDEPSLLLRLTPAGPIFFPFHLSVAATCTEVTV